MNKRDLKRIVACAALLVVIGAAEAHAVPTTFNDLTLFQTAASAASIPLTLDSLDFLIDSGLLSTITRPDYTVTDNDPPGSMIENNNSTSCDGGAQPTTGCITVTVGANGVTFTFDNAIDAFGLLVSKSDLASVPTISLNGNVIAGNYADDGSFDRGFFGLIDATTSFTSVTLAGVSPGTQPGLDSVRYGAVTDNPVPEPSSVLLLLGGLSGLGTVLWRQRSVR